MRSRGVVSNKRAATSASIGYIDVQHGHRRRDLQSVLLHDGPGGMRENDEFSEIGGFSETEDSDVEAENEASDLDEEYDRVSDFPVAAASAPSVPWPPVADRIANMTLPEAPLRAVTMMVPSRRVHRRTKPSFETRAAAAVPPVSKLMKDSHRHAALDALRAANHPDLAVEALLSEHRMSDALALLGDLRKNAIELQPPLGRGDAVDHPIFLYEEVQSHSAGLANEFCSSAGFCYGTAACYADRRRRHISSYFATPSTSIHMERTVPDYPRSQRRRSRPSVRCAHPHVLFAGP